MIQLAGELAREITRLFSQARRCLIEPFFQGRLHLRLNLLLIPIGRLEECLEGGVTRFRCLGLKFREPLRGRVPDRFRKFLSTCARTSFERVTESCTLRSEACHNRV